MDEAAKIEMELTPSMEKKLIKFFDIEQEIMQGTREPLPDGRLRITISVKGEKAEMMAKFCLQVIGRTDKVCRN